MKKLPLLLLLLALGALGLVACGGGDDDEATAASETETRATACGSTRAGPFRMMKISVIEGNVPCRVARGVFEDLYHGRVDDPERVGSWTCSGPDGLMECWQGRWTSPARTIQARAPGVRADGTTPASETETTAASVTETTDDALAADSKSCGAYERRRLAVVRGMSCREARRVIHDYVYGRPTPVGWICEGGDQPVECFGEAGERIRAPVRNAVLRRWEIEQAGNEWAALFAANRNTCRHMGQPACERMGCERVANDPIKNCTPPSPEFRESFADATVERVVVERHHATAEFSNGESVEFDDKDSAWFIAEEWVKEIARRNFEP